VVEAVAPHETTLDQSHTSAEPSRSRCRDESGGSSSENYKVIAVPGLGVDPLCRVDVVEQLLIVDIERLHQLEELWNGTSR
jgi:hypothetical protein